MGILVADESGARVVLSARVLVGRAPRCELRVDDARVSGEHARIQWTGTAWVVRDLASRNGTFVNGSRIEPGREIELGLGAELAFGGRQAAAWRMTDASEPCALAVAVASGARVEGHVGLLALPDDERPEILVFERAGAWFAEATDGRREPFRVHDGDRIEAGATAFEIVLPLAATETADAGLATIRDALLRFEVSRDEEYIELEVITPQRTIRLDHRAHHEVLLALARERLREHGRAPAEQGWTHIEDLARDLRSDPERINVDVYRARKHLAEHGVVDAVSIVERRRGVRQLRIGPAQVSIVRV